MILIVEVLGMFFLGWYRFGVWLEGLIYKLYSVYIEVDFLVIIMDVLIVIVMWKSFVVIVSYE